MKGQAMFFFLLMKGTSQRFGTEEAGSLFDIFFQTFFHFLKPGENMEACLGSEEKLSGTWSLPSFI